MTLQELSVDHDYYLSGGGESFNTWEDFYSEYGDADIDYNLIIRWDISKDGGEEEFNMKVGIVHQRKGSLSVVDIDLVTEEDVPQIIEVLSKHWRHLNNNLWNPISKFAIPK